MFLYYARLLERYRRRILPMAVFGYEEVRREPDRLTIVFFVSEGVAIPVLYAGTEKESSKE
ncbi:MAG: hypothetical protein BLM47_06785 [Candidatus Reconcilbacillus cellulovorans]|uniref:Uncharacterized protein n=1 Tax=Candidatus Reconcilbacillus cellulovorans TaxID=1906605 RepID=A0A2A6E0U5_9BACL|nr:MAG: hypothetical protein BLM47_06785 [Candidatus Reconcilbacillus cellulovorans]